MLNFCTIRFWASYNPEVKSLAPFGATSYNVSWCMLIKKQSWGLVRCSMWSGSQVIKNMELKKRGPHFFVIWIQEVSVLEHIIVKEQATE